MTALHKKATGWKTLEKETNQKPTEQLRVVYNSNNIPISQELQTHPYEKDGKVFFPSHWSAQQMKDHWKNLYKQSQPVFMNVCKDCGTLCDKKHYSGEESKDRYYPEVWDYPFKDYKEEI